MSETDSKLPSFVSCFRENAARLREESADTVADELGDAVLEIHGQLGVVVAEEDEDDDREVIVTALSDPSQSSLVHAVVRSVSDTNGWRFIALKPSRGFSFTLSSE